MNFKDEAWINNFCKESIAIQKASMKESGLSYFLKEEDYEFFLIRIKLYPKKLETILRIINNPDLFGYLYDKNSFIYNYLLSIIFKPFLDYKRNFEVYHPILPRVLNAFKQKNDYWFELFVDNTLTVGEEEVDLRYQFLAESRLASILHLSEENVNMFFNLINRDILMRILKILHDPKLIGYIYDENSFIYKYLYYELKYILARIDGLNQTYIKKPQLPENTTFMYNPEHNELWFDAFVNSRIYRNEKDEEIDLKSMFFDESKLDIILREENLPAFLTGIGTMPDDFKTLLKTVHDEQLLSELKTDNSLVRNSVENILKKALGLNVYEMPFVEHARKNNYKYTPDNFLSLPIDEQFEYFEKTGLNVFLNGFLEKEIKIFLKQMIKHKDSFKQILSYIDTNKSLLEDKTSDIYQAVYEQLLPFFLRVFGSLRFENDEPGLPTDVSEPKSISQF